MTGAQFDGKDIMKLSDQLKAILAPHDSKLQGAVLADLTAFWLAGHIAQSEMPTAAVRETLLQGFVGMVRRILPFADQMVRAHLKNQRHPQ